MTKRALSIGIVLALFSFIFLPSSIAAVTPGASCTKVGLTINALARKFTCIKSGKKLLWNAGVKVAAVAVPKPTPTAAPVVATPTPTVVAVADPPVDPSKYGVMSNLAMTSVYADAPVQSTLAPITFQYEAGTPIANQQLFANGANNFLKHFSNTLLKSAKAPSVMGYSTLAGGEKLADTYDPSNPSFLDDMKRTFASKPVPDPVHCGGFGGFSVGYESLIVIDSSCPRYPHGGPAVVTHELTHQVQSVFAGGYNPRAYLPVWFAEGQAQVIGAAMIYPDTNENPTLGRIDWAFNVKGPIAMADLYNMEGETSDNTEYNRGAALVEYLIARSGLKKSLEVIHQAFLDAKGKDMSAGKTAIISNFQTAFEKIYGQTLGNFYAEALPYLQFVSTHAPTSSASSTEPGTKIFLTENCHGYVSASLQKSDGGTWIDVAVAKGWDYAPAPCTVGTFRPWTIAEVAKGTLLRWHVYAPGAWDWYSTPYTY